MDLVLKLKQNKDLSDEEFLHLLNTEQYDDALRIAADEVRRSVYKDEVFLRGLIEFTNYCRNNCYYCGLRSGNDKCRDRASAAEQHAGNAEREHGSAFSVCARADPGSAAGRRKRKRREHPADRTDRGPCRHLRPACRSADRKEERKINR